MIKFLKLTFFVIVLFFAAAVFAEVGTDKQFPYRAQVIGTDVYVRSGSGIQYYFTSKVNEPAEVVVVDKRFSWCKIVPPAGSFSWIAKEFIKLDTVNQGKGIVTNDNVMVWAGAPHLDPEDSTSPQGKLNKDDVVQLLGEESGDYYKIAPPEGSCLWISGDLVKYVGPAEGVKVALFKDEPAVVADTNEKQEAVKSDSNDANSMLIKVDQIAPVVEKPKETFVSVVTRDSKSSANLMDAGELTRTRDVLDIAKKIDAEFAKPIAQQNYAEIQAKLESIINDNKSGKAVAYAQNQLGRIQGYKLAVEAQDSLSQSNKSLAQRKTEIQEILKQQRAKIKEIEAYDLKGTFRKSMVYDEYTGKQRFIIFSEEGKMLCYAIPAGAALTYNLDNFIGKSVGLIGSFTPDALSGIGVMRFEDIQLLGNVQP